MKREDTNAYTRRYILTSPSNCANTQTNLAVELHDLHDGLDVEVVVLLRLLQTEAPQQRRQQPLLPLLGDRVVVAQQLTAVHRLGEDRLHVERLAALLLGDGERLDALALAAAGRSGHHDLQVHVAGALIRHYEVPLSGRTLQC